MIVDQPFLVAFFLEHSGELEYRPDSARLWR